MSWYVTQYLFEKLFVYVSLPFKCRLHESKDFDFFIFRAWHVAWTQAWIPTNIQWHWGEVPTSSKARTECPVTISLPLILGDPEKLSTHLPKPPKLSYHLLPWNGMLNAIALLRRMRAWEQRYNTNTKSCFHCLYAPGCDLWNLSLTHKSLQSNTASPYGGQFFQPVDIRTGFPEEEPPRQTI